MLDSSINFYDATKAASVQTASTTHDANGSSCASFGSNVSRIIRLLEHDQGYMSFAQIQVSLALSQNEVTQGLRQIFQHGLVEHIPGNGFANTRYRIKKDLQTKNEIKVVEKSSPSTAKMAETRLIAPSWVNPLPKIAKLVNIQMMNRRIFFKIDRRPGGYSFCLSHQDALSLSDAILKTMRVPNAQPINSEFPPKIRLVYVQRMLLMKDRLVIRLNVRPGCQHVCFGRVHAARIAMEIQNLISSPA